jgi:hypothetical protein
MNGNNEQQSTDQGGFADDVSFHFQIEFEHHSQKCIEKKVVEKLIA